MHDLQTQCMETASEKRRPGVSVFFALAGMVVTFLLGVFVGLHPAWIPIHTSSFPDVSQPVVLPSASAPSSQPQTQPTEPSTT
jgi:hypothetical protein